MTPDKKYSLSMVGRKVGNLSLEQRLRTSLPYGLILGRNKLINSGKTTHKNAKLIATAQNQSPCVDKILKIIGVN